MLQYEILPLDLKGIDFINPKLRSTEESRKLLKGFDEVKISAIEIRDRIRCIRRKAARVHIEVSKQS